MTARRCALAAAALFAATLLLFWPGYALYDSVTQFGQALSGRYDDWHPPIMAALWGGLHRLVGGGAGPMLALQLTGWWAGLGLIAAALARMGRRRAGAAVLAIGLWPPFLGWQAAVLKDAQMAGALLAATGLVAWWRLRARPIPGPALAGAAILLGYAALVRGNAVFAVAPLVAILSARGWAGRLTIGIVLAAGALAAAGPVAHGLFGAQWSGIERTEAIFDLTGIAARAPDATLTPAERAAIVAKRCVTPYFWDPLGDPHRCDADVARLRTLPPAELYLALARAALAHPIAYARHRLGHLNSTERWLVPVGWPGAAPPVGNEPNALGLAAPGRMASAWQHLGGWLVETPFGWPACWLALAVAVIAWGWSRPAEPARDLALALAASAIGQEASFALLSIASDLRYHLWSMVATALAAVLLADRAPPRRLARIAGAAIGGVVLAGLAARLALPPPPSSYAGMLDGASAAAESL